MSTDRPVAPFAPLATRICSLWILAGALFKLFAGSPADLPPPVIQLLPSLDVVTLFELAIAIELATVALAWLAPAIGWVPVAGAYGVFLFILSVLIAKGEKSCGCFGSGSPLTPGMMFAVDFAFLALLLVSRPWRQRPRSLGFARLSTAVVIGALLAYAPFARFADMHTQGRSPVLSRAAGPIGSNSSVSKAPYAFVEPDPDRLPQFVVLNPSKQNWVGKPIQETELARWIDVDLYPQDATWLLYRVSCGHCRDHFIQLNAKFDPADPKQAYVLIRFPEQDDEANRQVDVIPPHLGEAILPMGTEWVIETPWTLELESGRVVRAYHNDGAETDIRLGEPAPPSGPRPAEGG